MASKLGLRERKRMQAMRRIQEAAVDLFDARGFENVTIEQIAEASEVSPSSVYRYFGTKEQVVLRDEYEPQFFAAVEAELASHPPVEALRRALSQIMTDYFGRDDDLAQRRTRYFLEEPSLRAAWAEQVDQFVRAVADALARAAGRRADELEIQVIASALVWSLAAAVRHWHAGAYAGPLQEEIERALAVVESGLQLNGREAASRLA
jgi:AcrR family transcriptional regulator